MFDKTIVRLLLAAALLAPAVSAPANVFDMGGTISGGTWTGDASLSFVTVGDPGNDADPTTGLGSVSYDYNICEYDVTIAQYCQFLNSVATKSDPYRLYDGGIGSNLRTIRIIRSSSAGSFSYSVSGSAPGVANMPVFDVTWGDAARFCNWLQNGQPTSGTEGVGTTETGAYTMNGGTSQAQLMAVASPGHSGSNAAQYFLPTENEWYKAAYYVGGGTNAGYWTYPTKSDTAPINTLPDTGNHANFGDLFGTGNGGLTDPVNYLTPVGSFGLSPGPYGTYDMGGDVWQWNETAIVPGSSRGLRGGEFNDDSTYLLSSETHRISDNPLENNVDVGFRVASSFAVPEPSSTSLVLACAVGFGIWRQRRKAGWPRSAA
jgi:formylglycine-generating enzyme